MTADGETASVHLHAVDLQWVKGVEDDPNDQCAHGRIDFRVGDVVFVAPADGRWTLSAAALSLLRTLDRDHTPENPVAGAQLFPCCGFTVLPSGRGTDIIWFGCPSGVDLPVMHRDGRVVIRSPAGAEATVSRIDWTRAVAALADEVRAFYDAHRAKVAPVDPHERVGWAEFWREWESRRRRCDLRTPDSG